MARISMNWKNAAYLVALAAMAYALIKLFDAEQAFPQFNLVWAALAILAYLASISTWNIAWGAYLGAGWRESNWVGWKAQFGSVTPFSLGNDVLRGYFAKDHGREFSESMAASLATKFYKIGIAFVFSIAGAIYLFFRHRELGDVLGWGVVLPMAMLLGVYIFTRDGMAGWLSRLTFNKITAEKSALFSNKLKGFIHHPHGIAMAWLTLSLGLEFFAFYAGFEAFAVGLPPFVAYLVFSLLFFISKIPLLPQGIVLTEFVGLILLKGTASTSAIAAGLLMWNASRIWAPIVISFLVFSWANRKKAKANEINA